MNDLSKGLLIGGGIAAGTAGLMCAATACASNILIKITLDPSPDITPSIRVKKLISGCRDIEAIEQICEKNKTRLLLGDCLTVRTQSHDKKMLVGHFHRAKDAKRTIIAMHGWRTSWARDFGTASEFFHKNRCNVLYIEQRGHGGREGGISFGVCERHDCLAWINFLNQDTTIASLPMYLCGVSMGAATVLMTTGFCLPNNVVGVIADCGFTSPEDIWKHVTEKNLHIPYKAPLAENVRRTCKRKKLFDPREYSTLEAMKHCKIPILFIHGAKDQFVPIEMTYKNFEACKSEKRLFIVPEAEHGMSYFIDKHGYEEQVLHLFCECDRRV